MSTKSKIESVNYSDTWQSFFNNVNPQDPNYLRAERALAITLMVLLIVGTVALAQCGHFAVWEHSKLVGFCCLASAALIVCTKLFLLLVPCCKGCLYTDYSRVYTDSDGGKWIPF